MASNTSSSSSPPTFSDSDKFDGTNWLPFKGLVTTATRLRGAKGYLDGNILKPSPPSTTITVSSSGTTTLTVPTSTEWSSASPSVQEWDQRDAWVLGLLQYNTKNPIGLGVKLDGSAAQAWKSLTDIYDHISDLAKINIQRELRDTKFLDGNDFSAHIANLRTLWTHANSAGSNISDTDFRTIILTSLPEAWDTIVATLYDARSSADTIARLDMHWSRINRNGKVSTATSSSVALQANAKPGGNVKRCANTNCKRKGMLLRIVTGLGEERRANSLLGLVSEGEHWAMQLGQQREVRQLAQTQQLFRLRMLSWQTS